MAKKPSIATPEQEEHLRRVLQAQWMESGLSCAGYSRKLFGSLALSDILQGASLTTTMLERAMIGLKALGTPLTRDQLLGSPYTTHARSPQEESVGQEIQKVVTNDSLRQIVYMLDAQLVELRGIGTELRGIGIQMTELCAIASQLLRAKHAEEQLWIPLLKLFEADKRHE